MYGRDDVCSTCYFWQRMGFDGICRKDNPHPIIVQKDIEYVSIWPKTNPDDWCGGHKKLNET